MKKLFIITIVTFLSVSLFAGPLQLSLDLSESEIELFGFTDDDPTSELTTLADAKKIKILTNLSIKPDDLKTGSTKEAKFYVWWYLYTKNNYTIQCYFEEFKATGIATTIPFHIEYGENQIDSLKNANSLVRTNLYTYNPSNGDNSGCILMTIPSFNYADMKDGYLRADYSTNIILEFTSV